MLPDLPRGEAIELIEAIRSEVARWHQAGFRDRNLDLRNILVRRERDGWAIAKIDSPRHRIVRPGRVDDALARADHARLDADLARLGFASEVRE